MKTIGIMMVTLIITGCAENAMIATVPPGANVYVDSRMAGTSPLYLTVKRRDIRSIPYRIEMEGYQPVEGVLPVRVAPGRAVGAFFTLGIVYIFRSPTYIGSVQHSLAAAPRESTAERLIKLKQLHKDGVLSDAEYDEQRQRILDGY
jgi:hypothetical protein